MLHIYTEVLQPATGWTDAHSGEPIQMGFEPEKLVYTDCCGKQRPAKDCNVQCYYDGISIWCAPDRGCKDPQVIAARKAREFANRSAGQKARLAKARANHALIGPSAIRVPNAALTGGEAVRVEGTVMQQTED